MLQFHYFKMDWSCRWKTVWIHDASWLGSAVFKRADKNLSKLTLKAPITTNVTCFWPLLKCFREVSSTNSVDLDQTAPAGAVWSGVTLFVYILILANYVSKIYAVDDISRCFFAGAIKVKCKVCTVHFLGWLRYMGLDVRKPVFGVRKQQRRRPACAFVQTGLRLLHSCFGKYHI